MYNNIYNINLKNRISLYKKTDFFFGMKIKYKSIFLIKNNISNIIYNKFKKNNLINLQQKEIFNQLINLCIKKGKKKLALKNVYKSFLLIRKFFWIDALFFIRLIIIQSESIFKLQKYMLGNKERVIPHFISFKKRINYVLRMLVKNAIVNKKNYRHFYISLAHSIIEYSLYENILAKKNKEENELAELNKYFLYKNKKKKRRRVRLLRKIEPWKKKNL